MALLISRHGVLIYTRYTDRHRIAAADAAAVDHYLETQTPLQAAWMRALGLDAAVVAHDAALIALADTLSLALCGELRTPLEVKALDRTGARRTWQLTARPRETAKFILSPWPFRGGAIEVECQARPMPESDRFADEATMRVWLAAPERVVFRVRLTRE